MTRQNIADATMETNHLASTRQALQQVLDQSATAWNAGDLDGFMESYVPSAQIAYVSGEHLVRGYDAIRAMYAERFGAGCGAGTMGQLSLQMLDLHLLGPRHAHVLGRFHLVTAQDALAQGYTSLVFEQAADGWKILQDHSG